MKKNIAIFASGSGTNAQQIIHHFKGHSLAQVALVVTNKPQAGVISIASEAKTPVLVIDKEKFFNEAFMLEQLGTKKIDWIILAGFLWKIPVYLIQHFPQKIINIHPALLPKYGGKGMYGKHVHQAVLAAKEKESGITIHFVNEQYDAGTIILQKNCPVYPDDNTESLAKRVQQLEHQWFPKTIEKTIRKYS